MKKLRRLTLACFVACSFSVISQAQALQPGIPVERELGPNQTHRFTVEAEANSMVQLVVEQKSIDVTITVAAPDGKNIGNYDTPNGANGPEDVSFLALTAGAYSITVGPLDPANTPKGRYQIKILSLRKATEEEKKAKENREIAKAKGIELLRELEGTISQIKSAATRIKSRVKAADLLWDEDKKRAEKYFSDATNDLKELLASVDPNDPEYPQHYAVIWQVRFDMLQLLAEIDPDKALSFLYSTVPPASPYIGREQSSQESGLELTIASRMMERDPQRAFQIARQSLKQGYSSQLIITVEELKQRDPKLATELANEMIEKLLTEKLTQSTDAGQLALNLIGRSRVIGSSVSVGEKPPPVIPDDKSKELVQKILDETLNFTPSPGHGVYQAPIQWQLLHGLKSIGADLDKIIPGSSAAVEKKFAALTGGGITTSFSPTQSMNGTIDEALEIIDDAPVETRDQLYYLLATREAGKGDIKRARELINDHVKGAYQRRDWLKQIEQQEISQTIASGRLEDAMRIISALRTPQERAASVTQLFGHIQVNQKPANALSLLEQARALFPASPVAEDDQQMTALLEIARAFAEYDSKRAFEILDPLVDQFNEICAAARVLQGFGGDFFRDDELSEEGSTLAGTADQMTTVIGSLALTNFERAKATADRIRQPEVRLRAYLDMAQLAIGGEN